MTSFRIIFFFVICEAPESSAESWISRDDWSLNLQWLILNVKCLLPPGTWARQPSPETSGFGWSWSKQMGRRMAPWGEEDLPQELWSVCAAEPDVQVGLKYHTSQPSQYHRETQSCSYGDIFISHSQLGQQYKFHFNLLQQSFVLKAS